MLDGITNDSKFYIFCPAGAITGGPELLHQLGDLISKLGRDVFIVYYKDEEIVKSNIPEPYRKYNVSTTTEIEFKNENAFIIPETALYMLKKIKAGIPIFWWLSVDNYFLSKNCAAMEYYNFKYKSIFKSLFFFTKEYVGDIIKHRQHRIFKNIRLKKLNKNTIHLYQSEYARNFLLKKGFSQLFPLKDYINDDYFNITESKSKFDTVIYNPKKGFEFTKELIKAAPSISWIPIQNMDREQVKDTLKSAKLYIDFGNHPGMDRMPREAAICGCCIITGKQGSAKFYQDVPISDEYKFNQSKGEIKKILDKIHYVLNNYEDVCHDFDSYREIIKHQKTDFAEDAKKLFIPTNATIQLTRGGIN